MTDELPPLVAAARTYLSKLRDAKIPPGTFTDTYIKGDKRFAKLADSKGLGTLLKALAVFIDQNQDMVAESANKALIERLSGADGKDIADALIQVAVATEADLPAKRALLQDALTVKGNNVLEAAKLAIKNIARDKQLQLEADDKYARDDDEDERKPPKRPQPKDEAKEKAKDEGTWRESNHSTDRPEISDADIQKSADQYSDDANKGTASRDDIRKSARDGGEKFKVGDDHLNSYERAERDDTGRGYQAEQFDAQVDMFNYSRIANTLVAGFRKVLEPNLSPSAGRAL